MDAILYTLIIFKFVQTTDSGATNLRDSNSCIQGLKSAQTQISAILQMSTYFYFNLKANNSLYTYHRKMVDPFLESQRHLDFDILKFTLYPNLRTPYCANSTTAQISIRLRYNNFFYSLVNSAK